MAMEHKAFAFDWLSFESELRPILEASLAGGTGESLCAFIDRHQRELVDPYEGKPIQGNWRSTLESGHVQELGDFALTKFYDPTEDYGLGAAWLRIDDSLPDAIRAALLGVGMVV